ncbi:hypothetical protein FB451DRAFT_1177546 [Mycena latifolia]|nr:hypothetical protein FB451DRAFT_1177546 [Mycena latifolia]
MTWMCEVLILYLGLLGDWAGIQMRTDRHSRAARSPLKNFHDGGWLKVFWVEREDLNVGLGLMRIDPGWDSNPWDAQPALIDRLKIFLRRAEREGCGREGRGDWYGTGVGRGFKKFFEECASLTERTERREEKRDNCGCIPIDR